MNMIDIALTNQIEIGEFIAITRYLPLIQLKNEEDYINKLN